MSTKTNLAKVTLASAIVLVFMFGIAQPVEDALFSGSIESTQLAVMFVYLIVSVLIITGLIEVYKRAGEGDILG